MFKNYGNILSLYKKEPYCVMNEESYQKRYGDINIHLPSLVIEYNETYGHGQIWKGMCRYKVIMRK